MTNNLNLYEQNDVVSKYSALTTRNRQLNIPERILIDKYHLNNKSILVLGSGGGRVPANLSLFNNNITAIEISKSLHLSSLKNYPKEKFSSINFIQGDALNLDEILKNKLYDVVFFPMNGIDLCGSVDNQKKIIKNMSNRLKNDGILCFTSHNIKAYTISPKVSKNDKNIMNVFKDLAIEKESVIGGGELIKSSVKQIKNLVSEIDGLIYKDLIMDERGILDKIIIKKLNFLRNFWFPYFMYVFKKVKIK